MKTTDWLIRGISEKKLKREKKRAVRKAQRQFEKIKKRKEQDNRRH